MSEYDILHDDGEIPGGWRHRSVSGKGITYDLPDGVSVGGFDVGPDGRLNLVLDIGGEARVDMDDRPVEVWVVDCYPDHIVWNYREAATDIGEAVGVKAAAEIAVEWMVEHPGEVADDE